MKPPSTEILRAFGVDAAPSPVAGGQHTTHRARAVALKPCDDAEEAEWVGVVLSEIEQVGFRVARPIRAVSGSFVAGGWTAFHWIEGETSLRGRWSQAIAAIRAFHQALRAVPRPCLFNRRTNVFAVADRSAWGEVPMTGVGDLGRDGDLLLHRLRPLCIPSQLVHADPSEGNLLFTDGLPPAIIDFAPYWRPAEYAVAMFIADAIAWSDAPHGLLDDVREVPGMAQLLLRAVLFRLIVAKLWRGGDAGVARRSSAYAPVIDAVVRWT
jgi:uncharacterized protein (TIGR02569 family)